MAAVAEFPPLRISVPQRRWAAADQEAYTESINYLRVKLVLINNYADRETKVVETEAMLRRIISQPVVVANAPVFREALVQKLLELEVGIRTEDWVEGTEELGYAISDLWELLGELNTHPWYRE